MGNPAQPGWCRVLATSQNVKAPPALAGEAVFLCDWSFHPTWSGRSHHPRAYGRFRQTSLPWLLYDFLADIRFRVNQDRLIWDFRSLWSRYCLINIAFRTIQALLVASPRIEATVRSSSSMSMGF